MDNFHPVSIPQLQNVADSTAKNRWMAVLLCFGLLTGSLTVKDQVARLFIFIAGLGTTVACVPITKLAKDNRRTFKDIRDVNTTALQEVWREFLTSKDSVVEVAPDQTEVRQLPSDPMAAAIVEALWNYKLHADFLGAIAGVTFTRLKFKPARGIKPKQIVDLQDAIAMELGQKSVSVENQGAFISVDVPRPDRQFPSFLQYIQPTRMSIEGGLWMAIGLSLNNEVIQANLADADSCHVLGGGTTGSGKSEWVRSAAHSIACRYNHEEVKFAFVDMKHSKFAEFNGAPYLWKPIVSGVEEAVTLINEAEKLMDDRYRDFAAVGVSSILDYNRKGNRLPRIVIFFDEYADLVLQDQSGAIEKKLVRLAQKAREAGIHLVLTTQRPEAKVVTPLIRSNLPVAVALRVKRDEDSKIILGEQEPNAKTLLGKGDLFYQSAEGIDRLQSLFVDEATRQHLAQQYCWGQFGGYQQGNQPEINQNSAQQKQGGNDDYFTLDVEPTEIQENEGELFGSGFADAAIASAIVDLAVNSGVTSLTAFVEVFFGLSKGAGKDFNQACDRCRRIHDSWGLNVWR